MRSAGGTPGTKRSEVTGVVRQARGSRRAGYCRPLGATGGLPASACVLQHQHEAGGCVTANHQRTIHGCRRSSDRRGTAAGGQDSFDEHACLQGQACHPMTRDSRRRHRTAHGQSPWHTSTCLPSRASSHPPAPITSDTRSASRRCVVSGDGTLRLRVSTRIRRFYFEPFRNTGCPAVFVFRRYTLFWHVTYRYDSSGPPKATFDRNACCGL